MDKIKKILLVNVPTGKCNFKCPYCFITQVDAWKGEKEQFTHSAEEIAKAFSKERFGGSCYINLCSRGETLIYPQMIEILKSFLEQGHYVEVVTNGTITKSFEAISAFPEKLIKHLSFKFSFHFTELKRLNLMSRFFDNVKMMQKAGASFTVELTPVDEEEMYIDEIKSLCLENLGALCHVTIARDDRIKEIPILTKKTDEEYYRIWETFDSEMFNFKKEVFQQKRNEFCYAGDWSLYINLFTGNIQKCYSTPVIGNIYDLSDPLKFEAIGACPISHCYNAHVMMTWGLLPEVNTPYYSNIRNRIDKNGNEWLQPEIKSFFETKLIESNEEYSEDKKRKVRKDQQKIMKRVNLMRKIDTSVLKGISSHFSDESRKKIKKFLRVDN